MQKEPNKRISIAYSYHTRIGSSTLSKINFTIGSNRHLVIIMVAVAGQTSYQVFDIAVGFNG